MMPGTVARRLVDDLRQDLIAYRKLEQMLDVQFEAALRLDAESLRAIAKAIGTEVGALAARRDARLTYVGEQSSSAARMADAIFPGPGRELQRAALIGRCGEIDALIRACKVRASRNSQLLATQFESMQRLLNGERHTYVPA
ncbi:flagellar export chaperone FlgN [Burkholderia semiarida]|uniref:Flagellar export chaperone FlgN n=1 Tax=Burkholderia semiarida TaxID=2843303 RepID=A0ABW7L8N3_9BURK